MNYRTVVVLSALLAIPARAADPVGLLSTVSGNVQIVRAGQKAPVPARTADLIAAGDRLITGRNSETMFLFCPERRAARIPPDSQVQFEAASIRVLKGKLMDEQKMPSCRLPSNLALSAASQQQAGIVRLRGGTLLLRFPSHTNIAELHPLFRWTPVENAKAYEIRLTDREEKVLWKQTVSSTEVRYPQDARNLEWGQKYFWRVAARDGDDLLTDTGSTFQILPSVQAQEVIAEEASLRKMIEAKPADNGARFLLAFLYEENGILDDAARAYGDVADRMGPQPWIQERLTLLLNKLGWDHVEPKKFE